MKKAYEVRWIENETVWLQMLRDRNETSHVYNEDMAKQIYDRIRENYPEMEQTYLFLFQRFST